MRVETKSTFIDWLRHAPSTAWLPFYLIVAVAFTALYVWRLISGEGGDGIRLFDMAVAYLGWYRSARWLEERTS